MQIVPFDLRYIEQTSKFLRSIYNEMGWGTLTDDNPAGIKKLFNLPNNGFLFLVLNGDTVVGTGGGKKLDNKTCLMKRFYLDKNYRGTGLADKLLATIVKKAKDMDLSKIVIDVSTNNPRAIKYYEKNGFIKYNQKPVDSWEESHMPGFHYYYFLII
jgi:ribosomal protein S18 acetylase RimI-like enzyme